MKSFNLVLSRLCSVICGFLFSIAAPALLASVFVSEAVAENKIYLRVSSENSGDVSSKHGHEGWYSFGSVFVGETRQHAASACASVTNTVDVVMSAVTLTGGQSDYNISNNGCAGRILAPGHCCHVDVAYSPKTAASIGSTLTLSTANSNSVFWYYSGTGILAPLAGVPDAESGSELLDNEAPQCLAGSIIQVDNLSIGESVPVAGADFSLSYVSNRVQGRTEDFKLLIPVTGPSVQNISSIDLSVHIAGKVNNPSLPVTPNHSVEMTWDGLDLSGQLRSTSEIAQVTLTHHFNDGTHQTRESILPVGVFHAKTLGLGGWMVSSNHYYDKNRKVLHLGSGGFRKVEARVHGLGFLHASEDGSELYIFDSNGRHLETRHGLTSSVLLSFAYSASGTLTKITDAFGNETRIENNGASGKRIVGPYGHVTQLSFDANGWLASVANPRGETYSMSHSQLGLLLSFEKPNGRLSTITYGSTGLLAKDRGHGGEFIELIRSYQDGLSAITSQTAMGRQTQYEIAEVELGTKRIQIDPRGLRTEVTYNPRGTSETKRPDGLIISSRANRDARWEWLAPYPGHRSVKIEGTAYAVMMEESKSAIVELDNPLALMEQGRRVWPLGQPERMSRESFHRVGAGGSIESRSAENRWVRSTISDVGLIQSLEFGATTPVIFQYDSRGRLTRTEQGTRVTQYSYDSEGNLVSVQDPVGRTTTYAHDEVGRVTTLTKAQDYQVFFEYDASGNLSSLQLRGRHKHNFFLNALDLLRQYLPPIIAGTTDVATNYTYNLDKQLTKITRPDGKEIRFNYDAAGVLSSVATDWYQDTYQYHQQSGLLASSVSRDGVTLQYTYIGPLLDSVVSSGPVLSEVTYQYDNEMRLLGVSLPQASSALGAPALYTYDLDSVVKSVGDLTIDRYAATGLLKETTLGEVTEERTYNTYGELAGVEFEHSLSPLYSYELTRNASGQITQKTETTPNGTNTFTYQYDLLGRLTEVYKNQALTEKYWYHSNGNRFPGLPLGNGYPVEYDPQDRLIRVAGNSYTYTANGELLSRTDSSHQTTHYSYDLLGSLKSVTTPDGRSIEYLVDASGRRVAKKVNSQLTKVYVYQSSLQIAAEAESSGAVTKRFIYSGSQNVPDYMITSDGTYRIITDHLGSPRFVVNTSTGAVVLERSYDAWGNVITDTNPDLIPFGFAGGLYDSDTKLVRFGARDYDPVVGRWTSKDPILFAGRDTNLYGYVLNDPVNLVDPEGLRFIQIVRPPPYVPAAPGGPPSDQGPFDPRDAETLFCIHYPAAPQCDKPIALPRLLPEPKFCPADDTEPAFRNPPSPPVNPLPLPELPSSKG